MDQHSPLETWRAVCRREVRTYRERGYSVASFKTSSAFRQFIIELHAHWRAMDRLSMEGYVPRPGRVAPDSAKRSTKKWIDLLDQAHGCSRRVRTARINYESGHGWNTIRYYGYRAWLRLEARRLIFCGKCAEQRRASPDCEDCKVVRKDLPKEALCPMCFIARGVGSACPNMGQCQKKAEKFIFKLHPPECGCDWKTVRS